MQIERDALCRIIESGAPAFDDLTGIPLGSQVEALADKIIAALSARPDDSAVERIVDAVIDAANIVSHDGYYEIDRDAATRAAIAAIGGE